LICGGVSKWDTNRSKTSVIDVIGFLCVSQTLIDTSKEVGLEVNTEKTKYMLLSLHQNAEQIHDMKIGNRCFENVAQLRYLGTTTRNQTLIREEIKNLSNVCYHSVQNILSSRLLSKS
jgi:hypothetical protein